MPRFRKKPVEIEAIQFTGSNWSEIERFMGVKSAWARDNDHVSILTLEGTMVAMPGDWMIRGIAGELYPCKPEIFEQTYEAIE